VNGVDNTLSVLQNTSVNGSIVNNSFCARVNFPTGNTPNMVVPFDLNADGKPDLVVTNQNSNTLSVFRNIIGLPTSPANLIAIPGSRQVFLKWNRSTTPDFLRYRIYSGTTRPAAIKIDSSLDYANDTTRLITGLTNGLRYYFRITSVDSSGNESEPSNEVSAIPLLPFQILSIRDVSNDQGKSVSIAWKTFERDSVRPFITAQYNVWRRDTSNVWTHVWQLPSRGDSLLSVVIPTLYDSTKVNGMHWSIFQITAHGTDPSQIAYSTIDSGYSIDNLAPNVPSGVHANVIGNDVVVSWNRSVIADFRYFVIYRSAVKGQISQGMTPYRTTTDTTFTDAGAGSRLVYYRISAVDFSGNESGLSPEISNSTTGVDDVEVVPKQYVLYANYPNPFNPSTVIRFGLPERSKVKLTIYDTLGKIVAILYDGELDASYQEISWKASVASGIYFCRLEAVSVADPTRRFVDVKKMVLLK
jgi:fibronectin type 3 domain-containing protein